MTTVRRSTLLLNAQDNVASALEHLKAGAAVPVEHAELAQPYEVTLTQDIPLGHKFALCDVAKGQKVIKFGMVIGTATQDIAAGAHVSDHNLE